MYTSKQLTHKINQSPNPQEAEFKTWQSTRYLVAQDPVSKDYAETTDGYYQGRHVIPGPKADPSVSAVLLDTDFNIIKHDYFIRFTDSLTTDSADESVGRAIYGIMTNKEADEYEEHLRNESS